MSSLIRSFLTWVCTAMLFAATAAAQNVEDHTYTSDVIEAGSRVYTAECALCHGPNGDIVDGIDLRLGQFRNARSDDDLRDVITTGVPNAGMPGLDLGRAELDGIVAYIRAGFDPEGLAVRVGDPARGQALFEGSAGCTECHRVNGTIGSTI